MGIFGKPAKVGVPVSEVKSMSAQGMDNNKIIQTLQRDGYSSSQIFEAINQTEMTPAVSGVSPEQVRQETSQQFDSQQNTSEPETPMPSSNIDYSQSGFKQPAENISTNIPSFSPMPRTAEVEELVESIIEEKWDDIVRDITKVVEWKNSTESRINTIEHEISTLREEFDKLHQAIIGKIGEYDKNILNVGAEVKAMEKVFSKVLPVFTEKVNQLADVADNIKKKPVKK